MREALFLLLAALLIACRGVGPSPGKMDEEPAPAVVVERLEIAIAQSFPVQVRLRIDGHLRDACDLADPVVESRGDTFVVVLLPDAAAGDDCRDGQKSFSRSIPLPAQGLKKGTYKVVAGERETSFTLSQDNVLPLPPAAPPRS